MAVRESRSKKRGSLWEDLIFGVGEGKCVSEDGRWGDLDREWPLSMRCDSRKGLEEVWKGAKKLSGGGGGRLVAVVCLLEDGDGGCGRNLIEEAVCRCGLLLLIPYF